MSFPEIFVRNVFKKDSFLGNVAKLMTGNVIAQSISLLTVPIITRLFPPESYGIFSLYTSIAMTFGIFSSLSYVFAILLPKEDGEAANIFGLCNVLVFVVSFLCFTTLPFFGGKIAHYLNAPQMQFYLWLLPLSIFFDGTYLSFNYWLLRKKRFARLSMGRVVGALAERSLALCAGFMGYVSAFILIISRLLGVLFSLLILGYSAWDKDRELGKKSFSRNKIFVYAKRYKKFPLISNWSILLNNTSRRIPVIMLGLFFPPKIVGFYALCNSVLGVPVGLLGDAIFKVFLQKSAEMKDNRRRLAEVTLELLHHLIVIIMLPMTMLTVIGREVFVVIFGDSWELAGTYAQITSVMFLLIFISRPFSAFFNVFEKQEVRLCFDIVLITTRVLSFLIGGLLGSALLAIALYSLSSVILFFVLTLWLLNFISKDNRRTLKVLLKSSLPVSPFLAVAVVAKFALYHSPVLLIAISVVLLGIYYSLICFKNEKVRDTFVVRG